jgi:hypothetical protein
MIAVWFREGWKDRAVADKDRTSADDRIAYAEVDRLGAVAPGAKFRLLLVLDEAGLREPTDDLFRQIGGRSAPKPSRPRWNSPSAVQP